jgi:hypothetical protein
LVVFFGQMGLQEADHRQRHGAAFQEVDDAWKPARQAGSFDASAGLVFAEGEHLDAVAEKRRKTLLCVNPTGIHLAEVFDDVSHDAALGTRKRVKRAKKIVIREVREGFHASMGTTAHFVLLRCARCAL